MDGPDGDGIPDFGDVLASWEMEEKGASSEEELLHVMAVEDVMEEEWPPRPELGVRNRFGRGPRRTAAPADALSPAAERHLSKSRTCKPDDVSRSPASCRCGWREAVAERQRPEATAPPTRGRRHLG